MNGSRSINVFENIIKITIFILKILVIVRKKEFCIVIIVHSLNYTSNLNKCKYCSWIMRHNAFQFQKLEFE